jgi:2-keto-4-pentenoate hydratase/2-oxohepta-3-ene-1,7-dioic acid hydratase in catechol pathway
MKWCRFELPAGPSYGSIVENDVLELSGPPFEQVHYTGRTFLFDELKLLPPVMPQNFYAAGRNFTDHIDWANNYHGMTLKVPQQADIGYRSPNALVGSGGNIVIPRNSTGSIEFEGELVAIVGRKAKDLTPENALDYIAGYTLGNDLSERDYQKSDSTLWRAKNIDTFKPMGPVVNTQLDPTQQIISVRVNGKEASSYSTSKMIFSLQHFLVRMTEFVTLHPGDVIWLGCDGPTLPALKPGDLVEVVNDNIGVLSNRVVKA